MKTLYFEGAGCVPRGDLENCRIRTAFTLDDGKQVYLEITASEVVSKQHPMYTRFKNAAFIDHCHYINSVGKDGGTIHEVERSVNFEYTRENLLAFVNSLGASFDRVVILPDLAGFRVHKDKGGYNFGDEFQHDERRTEQAEKIKQWFYDREKERGVQYPCFSIWFDGDLLRVRFFDGRGQIEIPDVYAFEFK
jgi:hypothetical protein